VFWGGRGGGPCMASWRCNDDQFSIGLQNEAFCITVLRLSQVRMRLLPQSVNTTFRLQLHLILAPCSHVFA
jgi:hypothetical protein